MILSPTLRPASWAGLDGATEWTRAKGGSGIVLRDGCPFPSASCPADNVYGSFESSEAGRDA